MGGCKELVVIWFEVQEVFIFQQELNWVKLWFLNQVCFSFYSCQMDGDKLTGLSRDWEWISLTLIDQNE